MQHATTQCLQRQLFWWIPHIILGSLSLSLSFCTFLALLTDDVCDNDDDDDDGDDNDDDDLIASGTHTAS